MSVGLAWKSAAKSNDKLVNQKYATLFLSRMPFSGNFYQFIYHLGNWKTLEMKLEKNHCSYIHCCKLIRKFYYYVYHITYSKFTSILSPQLCIDHNASIYYNNFGKKILTQFESIEFSFFKVTFSSEEALNLNVSHTNGIWKNVQCTCPFLAWSHNWEK